MSRVIVPYYKYLHPVYLMENTGVTLDTIGRCWGIPIEIERPFWADRICMLNFGVSAGNIRVCIYRDNGDTPVGGALVVQSDSIAKGVINRQHEYTITASYLLPGMYWVFGQTDEVTSTFYRCYAPMRAGPTLISGYYTLGAYGAFTDPCPAMGATNVDVPYMFLRGYHH